MSTKATRYIFGCLAAVGLNSCASPENPTSAPQGDGSGLPVVENADPLWPQGSGWRLAAQPSLSIGREDVSALRFNGIRAIRSVAHGLFVVVNSGPPPEIRIFDSDGQLRTVFGRNGEGPGEFRSLLGAWVVAPDTIVAFDPRLMRITWFNLSGGVLRVQNARLPVAGFVVFDRFADSSWLLVENVPQTVEIEGRVQTRRHLLRAFADSGRADTLLVLNEVAKVRERLEWETPLFFPGFGIYLASGDKMYAGYPNDFTIHVIDVSGGHGYSIKRETEPRAVSSSVFERLRESHLAAAPATRRSALERELNSRDRPKALPAFGQAFVVDTQNHLWVQGFVIPGDEHVGWSIFDPSGRYLGAVAVPSAFRPMFIDNERIVGVWRDSLDVETVRVYSVEKEGPF